VSAGTIQTVRGPISPGEAGVTLAHEHLYLDLRSAWALEPKDEHQQWIADAHVALPVLGEIRRDPLLNRDNLVLDDDEVLFGELTAFAEVGGGTVVDVTCQGMGRNANRVKQLSERTGVNVVAATGHYVEPCHPPDLKDRSLASIADEYIREIEEGIDGTTVRAGIIGEIGLSLPINEIQERVVEAAVIAQRTTGVAISIHPPWPRGGKHEVLQLLSRFGARLDRVILSHCCLERDSGTLASLADEGLILGFDTWGHEHYRDLTGEPDPRDAERLKVLLELLGSGYAKSVVLSQDLACKIECRAYGGWGLTHVDKHIVPALERSCVDRETIRQMRIVTPARVLTKENSA
jgi:phosphotriesterase-related protein